MLGRATVAAAPAVRLAAVRGYDAELAEVARGARATSSGSGRRRAAAGRRGGPRRRRHARRRLVEDRGAAGVRAARRRRRGRGAARAARGDRGQPRGDDRRHRHRVPARLPGRRCGARGRCSGSCKRRVPAGRARAVPAPSSAGSSRPPATPVTSTSTCSSSSPARRSCPSRCAPTSSRCCAVLRERRLSRAPRRWCGRCAPSERRRCSATGPTFLDELGGRPRTVARTPTRPIGELAGERIRKVYRRMVRMGGAIDDVESGRGLPRAAQEGQGAPLPARAVRRRRCSPPRSSSR